jgi:tRNA (guanine10-N2)-dimethyltransferase
MEFLIKVSKENISFSISEIEYLLTKVKKLNQDYVKIKLKKESKYFNRLSLSKKILRILFYCNENYLINKIKKNNLKKYYKENFSLRKEGKSKLSEKEIALNVFKNLKNAKVDLKNSKTKFEIIFINNKAYFCLNIFENKDDFNLRKAHKRPEHHPSSLNPRLAKACINLTGIKKGKLYDPFCGSGGILIEAGLMNLKPIGYDIDKIMINRSRINLEYYNIKNYELKLNDALKLNKKINYIVTDLPYGKNTKQKNTQELYYNFLNVLSNILVKKAVIISPDYVNFTKIKNLIIEKEFTLRVHKSMTRKIRLIKKLI